MDAKVSVKLFGKLQAIQKAKGKPILFDYPITAEGRPAIEILRELELPVEAAEGVFINHKVYPLSNKVMPGDEIAFVPKGIPGPHRYTLGLFAAGRGEEARHEEG